MKEGITVILTRWKRPENVKLIIDALLKQTIKPTIFLWNNNPDSKFRDKRVDWIVNSSVDKHCFVMWGMALVVETKYLMKIDDDLIPNSNNFLEKAITLVEEHPNGIVGPFGRRIMFGQTNPYNGPEIRTDYADIVKGRCMCMRTEILNRVPLVAPGPIRNEDIYICYHTANGKKNAHFISLELRELTKDLPEGNVGMDNAPDHMTSRNEFIKEMIDIKGRLG